MTPDILALIIALGAGAALLLLGLAFGGGAEDRFDKRLARAGQDTPRALKGPTAKGPSLRRSRHYSTIPLLDVVLRRLMPNPDKLRRRLARTGRRVSMGEYVLMSVLLAAVTALCLRLFVSAPWIAVLGSALIMGLGLPHAVVGLMGALRVKKFLEVFPDAIDLIVRGVRSGLPVTESIMTVGRELPDPVGVEFRRVGDAIRLGQSLDHALWDVAARLDAPEFRFLIIAMSIQRETGGNLAETLANLSALLRRRRQLRLKIKALSAEAKASALIIGLLPFIMFFMISAVNPDYAGSLLTDPRGVAMLTAALALIVLGAVVMTKMVNFDH